MNNILPHQCRDFMNQQYWKKFFKKIKKEGHQSEYYEWYGDYASFDHLFKALIKQTDLVMHAGCGKSLLSEQLYDNGICKNIVNVDFEKQSLEQMRKRSEQTRPEMKFESFSLLDELPIPENQFDVILDKGTLDAIYPDEEIQSVNQYIANMHKILKVNGKLIIISLLQEHVLRKILNERWDIEIYETVIDKSKLYPFLVVLSKREVNNGQKNCVLETLDKNRVELSYAQCEQSIKKIQLQNHFVTAVHKLRQSQQFTIDLWNKENKQTPRYTLFIYDNDNAQTLLHKTCACFIIPQGREQSYLFATTQGHKDLQSQAKMSRLVIARMNPGHKFDNMKLVQQELSNPMRGLIPKGCTNQPCPFMTDGDEIGNKAIIFESEDCIVEDFDHEESKYRRLILKNSLDLIQCQARIQNNKIDNSYLDFEAHVAIAAGLGFNEGKNVLILGGGVGILSRFMAEHLHAKVTNVELCEDIVNVAKCFFDYKDNEQERMVCCDGLDYIEQAQKSKEYDIIVIDINSSQQNTLSPPKVFLDNSFLKKLGSMLTDQGVIIINVIDPLKELKKLDWDIYYSRKCENELNEVYYLLNVEIKDQQLNKDILDGVEKRLKETSDRFKNIKTWDSVLNMPAEVGEIKLKYPVLNCQKFQTQEVQLVKDGQVLDSRKDFYQEDMQKAQKKKNNRKRKNKQ